LDIELKRAGVKQPLPALNEKLDDLQILELFAHEPLFT
jgi:hypothetical protein